MAVTTENVTYQVGESTFHGLFAFDQARTDRRPGVLVVHGGAGLDDHAKGRARRFAEAGFVVFACDMYGQGVVGNRERTIQCITELRGDRGKIRQRAQPAVDLLASHPQVDGRLAVVGYCFGGMIALELARCGAELEGVVSVHGTLDTSGAPASEGTLKAKILVCHGALDPHVPMTQASAFCEEMTRAHADYQLIVYGGAMHGFTHETADGRQPGVAYHAPSDARSSAAIRTFFGEIFD
jgi:dienelactone hydrolase